ncbi:MAG: SpoIID/LytB domain-containing protein [Thermoleophilaceae bacterium]
MRRIALLTALALFLAVPATAGAAVRHVVKGAGFGHGIGMSQYGAYGYVLEGSNYRGILEHYYSGTTLSSAPGAPVRVLLQPVDPYIRFRDATNANGRGLRPGTTYVARLARSGISLKTSSGKRVATFASPLRVAAGGDDPVRLLGPALNSIRDGLYRGTIEVIPDGGGLTAINVIDLDPYLKGVVAGEMPSSWPLEALKVQAVAARTYALATRKTTGSFDQYPDTRSQVYKGVVGESASSNAAVDQTAGEILTYAGVPAVTYYFSTSGGHTENVEYSFVGSLSKPWLVGVPDPYDHYSPYHRWQATFSAATLDRALGAPGKFVRLKALQRGVSPRVVRAEVIGTRGRRTVSGPQVRAALGLRDTWFTHVRVASSARRPRSARPASWGPSLRLLAIAGEFRPAPRGRRLAVQRKMGEGWRTVSRERTSRLGRYRAQLEVPGVYRVKAGSVAGPPVRVR